MSETTNQTDFQQFLLLKDFNARNVAMQTKLFKKDSIVDGTVQEPQPNTKQLLAVITSDGYLIPAQVLNPVPVVALDAKDDVLTKTENILKNNSFTKGAMIGVFGGAAYGFFKNKSVFLCAMVGLGVGGVLTYMHENRKKTK